MSRKHRINVKQKGNRWELAVSKFLVQCGYPYARRSSYAQSRQGEKLPDVIGTPFWVECKAYRQVTAGSIRLWMSECIKKRDRRPIVLFVKDGVAIRRGRGKGAGCTFWCFRDESWQQVEQFPMTVEAWRARWGEAPAMVPEDEQEVPF